MAISNLHPISFTAGLQHNSSRAVFDGVSSSFGQDMRMGLANNAQTPPKKPVDSPGQGDQGNEPYGDDVAVLERKPEKLAAPPSFQVVLLNDDYTPMEFVVDVLQGIFNKDGDAAVQIMLKIHTEGRGVCGVYSKDIALTKVEQVLAAARESGHPLQAVCEPVA